MIRSTRLVLPACLFALALGGCEKAKDAPAATDASDAPASTAAAAPAALATDAQRMGYALGASVGRQFKTDRLEVDADSLAQGVRDAFTGAPMLVPDEQIATLMQQLQQAHQQKMQTEQQEVATRNRTEGEAFLAQNKSAEGVTTTASGLQYRIERAGDGPKPKAEDTVKVHYKGTLRDGTEFDSSYTRGEPVSFPVNAVIPGWVEALQLMPVGSKWHLYIPSELAYGPGGAGGKIGPNSMLEFDVELLAIEAPKAADAK